MPSLRHARVIRCAVLQSIRLDESRYTFPAALLCSSFRGTFSSWTSTDSVHFDDCNWQQAPPKAAGAECHTDSSAVARNLAIADVIAVFSGATLAAPSREDCTAVRARGTAFRASTSSPQGGTSSGTAIYSVHNSNQLNRTRHCLEH